MPILRGRNKQDRHPLASLKAGHQEGAAPKVSTRAGRSHGFFDWVWALVVLGIVMLVVWYWPLWDEIFGGQDAGTYHSALGLERGADPGAVKRAYRTLARRWHPDQNPNCGETCRERMRMVQDAYSNLMANPDADAGGDEEDSLKGFVIQLFVGRLIDMAFVGAEFVGGIFPMFVHAKTPLSWATMAFFWFYFKTAGVYLSYFGMGVCVWKMLKAGLPNNRVMLFFQWRWFCWAIVPAVVVHFVYALAVRRQTNYYFILVSGVIGMVYMASFILNLHVRIPIIVNYYVRLTHPVSFMSRFWLLLEILKGDLFAYLLKVPPAFRIAAYLILLYAIYQRWAYERANGAEFLRASELRLGQDELGTAGMHSPFPRQLLILTNAANAEINRKLEEAQKKAEEEAKAAKKAPKGNALLGNTAAPPKPAAGGCLSKACSFCFFGMFVLYLVSSFLAPKLLTYLANYVQANVVIRAEGYHQGFQYDQQADQQRYPQQQEYQEKLAHERGHTREGARKPNTQQGQRQQQRPQQQQQQQQQQRQQQRQPRPQQQRHQQPRQYTEADVDEI